MLPCDVFIQTIKILANSRKMCYTFDNVGKVLSDAFAYDRYQNS